MTSGNVASAELDSRAGVPTFLPLGVSVDANALSNDGARRIDCVSSPGAAYFVGN
ncbi:hypothetical protein STRIP9103_09639 [Streptomyces ipomoeae 91-03]|uniref:Uncharacterized protein n=1 Tax=Streptomyces ipomoeae 91-03 TaxID=698759 RepID=L1L059_9ACTN|nr:hypothetical protein STRIP9103_09639 [Streptomyces ipomoeae 91-03]